MPAMVVQPPFDRRLTTLAYPLTGGPSGGTTLQSGYMVWDKPLPGYGQRAVIRYLYNPSTVAADYNIADASAQASLNFPNPGDTGMLAIPLSQTATWSLMFDRTFELWGSYAENGLPVNASTSVNAPGLGSADASAVGVQADVLAFMQFTGMLTNYSYGTSGAPPTQANANLAANAGIMQLVPSWAYFGNSSVANGLMYFGYINEWSVQYTHWTQYNVPMRCVVNVNFTMLPMPNTQPPTAPGVTTLPNGQPGPGATGPGVAQPVAVGTTFSGIGGR